MKKIFVFILIVILIISNTISFATGITDIPSTLAAVSSPDTASVSLATPSIEPPMIFSVATVDGSSSLVLSEIANSAVKLVFNISPKGSGFSEEFTIQKIVNTSNNYVYDYNRKVEKGTPGWAYTTDVTFTNTDAGKSITFELHWTDFSGKSRVEKAQIKVEAPVPQLTVTTASVDPVIPGVPVEIKYTIKNTGNVALKNVLLSDATVSYLNSGFTFTPDSFLAPGETIEKTASIIVDGEIKLAPEVSFSYNNSTRTVKGEEFKLSAQEVIPSISLTCDNYTVDKKGVTNKFNYTITNTTQVPLTDIFIYDSDSDGARLVDTVQMLEVGQTHTGSYELSVTKSGYYKFKIHYKYQGADMDKQQFAKTDKPIKLPNEVFFDIIKVSPESLNGPGKMTFTVLVENDTVDELRDLTLSEANNLFDRIVLSNIVVPAAVGGEKGKFQYDFTVDVPLGTTQIQLTLNYMIGGELAVLNTSRDIIITESYTPVPTETVSPTASPNQSDSPKNSLLLWIWICIFILLLLIALIIVLIVVRTKVKKNTEPVSVKRKVSTSFEDPDGEDEDYDDYDDSDTFASEPLDAELSEPTIITDIDNLDEEFGEAFDDDYDDEGVKIYKGKK